MGTCRSFIILFIGSSRTKNEVFGQALVEFIGFSIISTTIAGIVGSMMTDEWNRSKCAYLTFEYAHNYLIGRLSLRMPAKSGFVFRIEELDGAIVGIGQCGRHVEKVRLPVLESAHW